MTDLPTPQEYAERHKKAFRIAFDFLNAHFPPTWDNAWWEQTAKDAGLVSDENENEMLCMELLTAVISYLDKETKKRKREDNP